MPNLNHIGIAVHNLPALKKLFSLLKLEIIHVEAVPEQDVTAHFIELPLQPTHLELLEVTDPKGTLAKFIDKKGPGIHHLSFLYEKGQLVPLCEKLKKHNYKLVYDNPQHGAHRMLINFVHPKSAGGILIELMEPQD
ncbi:MAG: VOC family protein [Bdellovibrio sp.]|nr:VOC family protein [Bdellovibrio sp.]